MPILLSKYGSQIGTGSPTQSDPGTGLYVPAGVEAVHEFNGLLMNVRDNLDRIVITQIDGLWDSDIADAREANPGYDGETEFEALNRGRTFTVSGRVEAQQFFKLRDLQDAIRGAFNDLIPRPWIFRTGDFDHDHYIVCRKSGPISGIEAQTNQWNRREFQLTMRASSPAILSFREYMVQLDINDGLTLIVHNRGNYTAKSRLLFRGEIDAIELHNVTTGQVFSMTGGIPDGDVYTIDNQQRMVTDQAGEELDDRINFDSDYIDLAPGDNFIDVVAGSFNASARLTAFWRHTWK